MNIYLRSLQDFYNFITKFFRTTDEIIIRLLTKKVHSDEKDIFITGIVVGITIIALIVFNNLTSRRATLKIFTEVKKGSFEISVSAAGELIAENSIDIKGPVIGQGNQRGGDQRGGGMQHGGNQGGPGRGSDMHVADLKMLDIVPEGTIVKQGDYVAQLDRSSYDNTLKDELQTLLTYQQNVEMKILNTTVALTDLRDEIKNQKFAVEEAKINLDQSKYEPPATIRQAGITYDRAKRTLEQKEKAYALRVAQTLSEINHEKRHLERETRLVKDLQEFLAEFTIKTPSDGMIIYKKERNGTKRKTGSTINPFDMIIATLPDLSTMISKTYINEIDVSKVKSGQQVSIIVDAFPKKSFKGYVTDVANIGEQLPNSDAKMFETQIKINRINFDLRPSMTTGNKILLKRINDAIYIPLECVQTGRDSIPFVYEKNKTKTDRTAGRIERKKHNCGAGSRTRHNHLPKSS